MPASSPALVFSSLLAASAGFAQLPANAPTPACLTDGTVHDLLLADGVVYLAGAFSHVRPPGTAIGDPEEVERLWFAACDAATGVVLAWDPQVTCDGSTIPACANPGYNPRGQTLALAADRQSIYLGGKFRGVGGLERRHAARVARSNAAVDPAWMPEPSDRVQRIVVAPEGSRVFLAGNFTQVGGCSPAPCHAHLAAVDPVTGAAVAPFAPTIRTPDGGFTTVYSVAFSEDGETLYFGGQFAEVDGEPRSSAAAVDAETGLGLTPFAPQLADANPGDPAVQVHDLLVGHEWVYLCGDWWATAGLGGQQDQRNVNRFHPSTGAVDLDFWIATDGGVQACALDPNLGVLFVGGHFDCVRAWLDSTTPADPNPGQCGTDPLFVGTQQRDLFALSAADGALLAWNPDTGGAAGSWAMARAEGRLLAGGEIFWPRTGAATHQTLLAFDVPLFADGFERGDTDRWSATQPPP